MRQESWFRIPTVISTCSYFSFSQVPATAQPTSAESNASADKLGSSKVITRTKVSCAFDICGWKNVWFSGLILESFSSRAHQKYCNDNSHLRLLRLLQTHQSQQTSLPKSAAVPRWADLMLTILQILLRQWKSSLSATPAQQFSWPQFNFRIINSFISGFTFARFPSCHLSSSGCYRPCQASRHIC